MHIGKATNFFSGGWFNSLVVGAPNNSSAGDGQILIGDTTAGYLTAYHSGTFKPLYLDGSTLTVRYAGNAKLTFDGNMGTGGSLYPTFDGQANLGTNANKFAFVKTVEAFTTSQHTLGGLHNTSGAVTRGYMVASAASNTDATGTGYLSFHGQNGTRYGYIGNGAGTLAITLENNAFIDASMPSNTGNPMFRLTRQDDANNHLEMLGTGTVSKAHIGSLGDVMYLGASPLS